MHVACLFATLRYWEAGEKKIVIIDMSQNAFYKFDAILFEYNSRLKYSYSYCGVIWHSKKKLVCNMFSS